jgi:hypothetical protein
MVLLAGCVGEIGESKPPSSGEAGTGDAMGAGGGSGSTAGGGGGSTGVAGTTGTGGGGSPGNDQGGSTGTGGGVLTGTGGGGSTGVGGGGSTGTGGRGGTTGVGGGGSTGTGGRGGTTGVGGGTAGRGGATGAGGLGGAGTGGAGGDPLTAPATCTSKTMWTQANRGSSDMNPGKACITCHSTMNGPSLTIGGTVYPTGHEPDLCNGANGSNGARVVITGADGKVQTLTPGTSGNFNSRTTVALPFKAKVTYMGRERAMVTPQSTGDCNSCHTQNGANGAPGRIVLP